MKLLCLGDSLTYGYDVRPQERWTTLVSNRSTIEIDNKGQCGDTTAGMVFRLHQLDLIGYDAFFVMGGSNDILLDKDFSAVCRNMESLVSLLKSQEEPVYIGIPPLTKSESAYYGWQEAGAVHRHNEILRRYRQCSWTIVRTWTVRSSTFIRLCWMAKRHPGNLSTPTAFIPMPKLRLFAEAALKVLAAKA